MNKPVLIKATGEVSEIAPENPEIGFTLQECQELIGCDLVEVIRLSDGRLMIIDESGKVKKGPVINDEATVLYRNGRKSSRQMKDEMRARAEELGAAYFELETGLEFEDCICGNAIVCDPSDFR